MVLSLDDKYVASAMFRSKLHESDKQTFEDVFTQIAQCYHADFKQVKPMGSRGDGKCDGFIEESGEFFQVYAPEDITGKTLKAVKKLNESFGEILTKWTAAGFTVKKLSFVVNDKYKGVGDELFEAAKQFGNKNNVVCKVLLAKDLENIFLSLPEECVTRIVGLLPNPDNLLANIELENLRRVISHLMKQEVDESKWTIPENPDFDAKIQFNKLSPRFTKILNTGQLYVSAIDDFFRFNSDFHKEELRKRFSKLYMTATKKFIDIQEESKANHIFCYIVQASAPEKTAAVLFAVYIVMAYYFEHCDIFEAPPKKSKPQQELF